MHRTSLRLLLVVSVCGSALMWTASPAPAHERRTVGRWTFVVGWGTEPAYAGFPNSVQVMLSDENERPVVDLRDTLEVEVIFGAQTTTLALEPRFVVGRFGTPGDYRANLTPTRVGTYTFHVVGTIKGDRVDERFTSGEDTFDSPRDNAEVQFPAKDPSTAQLNQLLAREVARVADKGDTSRVLAYVGIGLGALGIAAAALGGRRRRGTPVG